jgi:agmatinase
MSAKLTLLGLFLLSLGTPCVGHDGHDENQMPMDYVRYPYQAAYPGDDSG